MLSVMDARRDLELLLDHAVELALDMLRTCGAFLPYGAGLRDDGTIESLGSGDADRSLIERVRSRVQQRMARGEFRAIAVIYDADIDVEDGSNTEAVAVELEHVEAPPVMAFLTYERSGGDIVFGRAFTEGGPLPLSGPTSSS
ncbi:MAG: hypothetical protein AAGE01_20975 [Pseudomonadota bacterium]